MDELQPIPISELDPYTLPALLDERLLVEVLLPHCHHLFESDLPYPDTPPRWTIQLELWFQTFHPATWEVLKKDTDVDEAWLEHRTEKLGYLDLGCKDAEDGGLRVEGVDGPEAMPRLDEYIFVVDRCEARLRRLFALVAVRDLCLKAAKEEQGIDSEDSFVRELPFEAGSPVPRAAVHSVWPLPSPAPVPHLTLVSRWNISRLRVPYCSMPAPADAP
ncbi:hypothetical protein JCM10213_004827 [Rhodosporidiobolus nylandii]